MGYETCLIFVSGRKNKGYHSIEATMEIGKMDCESKIYGVIEKVQSERKAFLKANDINFENELETLYDAYNSIYDVKGNHTEEYEELSKSEQKQMSKTYYGTQKKLESKLPFIYHTDGNNEDFSDQYDNPLLMTSLKEVKEALQLDNAKLIHEGDFGPNGYAPYVRAIKLIESFEDADIKVILWGH